MTRINNMADQQVYQILNQKSRTVYRMRIGSNRLRSVRLPHSKLLSSEQLLLYMLFAHYKLIGITMFILSQIICVKDIRL
jgi:hypothetical protein